MHRNIFFALLIILLLSIITACKKTSSPADSDDSGKIVTVSDLLPKDNEISGWQRLTGCSCYSWTASNNSELQSAIDGGYELFAKYGFVEAAMQKYQGSVNVQRNVPLEIQIYDQGKPENADAVFDDPSNVFPNPITPNSPPSPKAQIKKEYASYSMKFSKSRYYVLMSILTIDDKAQNVLEVFAANIAGKIR